MNIVFFGSSDFALPSLEALSATQHKISCVVTQPDKVRGRGLSLSSTPIKRIALRQGLCLYQPVNINSAEALKFLSGLGAHLFIVIAYGQILSLDIVSVPSIFSINLHASLLPKYRGAAPVNRALINGESQTGLTIIKMNEKMDSGEIITQKTIEIDNSDCADSLEKKLALSGADLLLECLKKIENGTFKLQPQDETGVSLAPKLKKKDGLIDWRKPALQIVSLIRGTTGWPGAFTYFKDKIVKVYKVEVIAAIVLAKHIPGEIIRADKEGLLVATGRDNLLIKELQLEGKRQMKAGEFIAGHKIEAKDAFGLRG